MDQTVRLVASMQKNGIASGSCFCHIRDLTSSEVLDLTILEKTGEFKRFRHVCL